MQSRGGTGAYEEYLSVGVGILQVVLDYTTETIDALETTLSRERLSKYVVMADGDRAETIRLYAYNTKLSEALYTPLQGIEVCLRNAIDRQMSQAFGPSWFQPAVSPLRYPLTEMALKATASARAENKEAMTRGHVVADLSFGFWTGILGPRYETALWRPVLRHAFPYRPRGHERKGVQGALNAVRRLRNRVAHHEPILQRRLADDHALIIEIVSWICPHTAAWVARHSRFFEIYE